MDKQQDSNMSNILPPYIPLYKNKDKFITLVTGGRGSGKSFEVMRFTERLTFEKGHKILLTRYTLSSAKLSVIPELTHKIELDGTQDYFKVTEKDVINTLTGSEIMFRGIKTSSGNQTANLKSIQGLTTFIVDEGEEWVSEVDYDKLVLSIRQQDIQNRIIIIMNPTNINHFIYDKYIKDTHKLVDFDGVKVQISTHPNVLHIHTTYLDNVKNLSSTFINEVNYIKTKDPDKYANVVIGRWSDNSEGAIYQDWEIVDEMPKQYKKRFLGLDFGFNDPTAIVEVMLSDDCLYINEICYSSNLINVIPKNGVDALSIERIIKDSGLSSNIIIADCQAKTSIEELKNVGFRIEPSIKGSDSILNGINAIKKYKLKVTRKSHNIIYELRNYCWDKNNVNMPIDKYNHAMDAMRYVALNKLVVKPMSYTPLAFN